MNRLISSILCVVMLLLSLQISRADGPTIPNDPGDPQPAAVVLYICVVGGVALLGGFVYYKVKSCKPKYYCVRDLDGNVFSSNATKTERAVNDWVVVSGPYDSAEAAAKVCPPATNQPPAKLSTDLKKTSSDGASSLVDEVYIPTMPMTVWYSTNLTDWSVRDRIEDDPSHFSWIDTNEVSRTVQGFYKVTAGGAAVR